MIVSMRIVIDGLELIAALGTAFGIALVTLWIADWVDRRGSDDDA